jgi:hypothetical protein
MVLLKSVLDLWPCVQGGGGGGILQVVDPAAWDVIRVNELCVMKKEIFRKIGEFTSSPCVTLIPTQYIYDSFFVISVLTNVLRPFFFIYSFIIIILSQLALCLSFFVTQTQ